MKVFPPFLLALLAALTACNNHPPTVLAPTTPDYQKGVFFMHVRNDSAFYYFNKVATGSKDSLQVAMAYNNMAVIQRDEGDYYGGQETLLASLKYLHEDRDSEQYCLVADYNALGSISQRLNDYDAAITFYDRALPLIKNEGYKAIALNNKAFVYQKKGLYAKAIAIYDSILPWSKKSKKEYARTITNLATTMWLQDSTYDAAPDLLIALQLRKALNDDWGLNSSYAHLSDYYLTSRPDSALLYTLSMYAVASQLQSPDDELEALQKLIKLGPAKELKGYFIKYQHLSDSLQMARNTAKNQFALIRYQSEKNKTENLRLQQDNTQKQLQIIRQRITIFASIAGIFIVLGFGIAYTKDRLRKSKLKTSRKVHDVVANGLYQLMAEIEHGDHIEKEPLLNQLEDLYERSRDISYDLPEATTKNYQQLISDLLTSFSNPSTKVLIAGNEQHLWDKVTGQSRQELKPILQELMINMQKHSGARNVVLQFQLEGPLLKIRYADDGVGLPPNLRFGNGLTNTGNRIKHIGGRITFDQESPRGLKLEIQIPISTET